MTPVLNVTVPVSTTGSILVSVETTCVAGMDIIKVVNDSGLDVDTCFVSMAAVLSKSTHADKATQSVGLTRGNPVVIHMQIDRFTQLEMVVTRKDERVCALAKVKVRSGLYFSALYTSDSEPAIMVNKFKDDTKEMASWRKPLSRLSSALKVKSK